jgi:hypothetical protein
MGLSKVAGLTRLTNLQRNKTALRWVNTPVARRRSAATILFARREVFRPNLQVLGLIGAPEPVEPVFQP